jgi:hypothetical protein
MMTPVVTIVDQFGVQMTWRKRYGRVIINPRILGTRYPFTTDHLRQACF